METGQSQDYIDFKQLEGLRHHALAIVKSVCHKYKIEKREMLEMLSRRLNKPIKYITLQDKETCEKIISILKTRYTGS